MISTSATRWQLPKLVCPHCTCDMSRVVSTEPVSLIPHAVHDGVRRRRECAKCRHRYTTLERIIEREK